MSNVLALKLVASKADIPEATDEPELELNARALLVLSIDVKALDKMVERIQIQVHALAKRHGV